MSSRYPHETEVPVPIPTPDGKAIAEIISVTVPCRIEEGTGEPILGGEALRLIDRAKARYMGLLLPEEIAALRERLGMTQKDMCELLKIGAKTYSRWETGRERPSQSMNLLLCGLTDGKLTVPYLRSRGATRDDWWTVAYNWSRAADQRRPYTVDVSEQGTIEPICLEGECNETKQFAA